MTTLSEILNANPELADAYNHLRSLDANGACCAANDIEDAHASGVDLSELAAELRQTCEDILARD
jgi:hypothetical protein